MARELVAALTNQQATQASIVAAPTGAGDGVDVTAWRSGPFGPTKAVVLLDGSAGCTVPLATLWGYIRDVAGTLRWCILGTLNGGSAITITDLDRGFAQAVDVVGVCERLAVSGTPSAGTVQALFIPTEVQS